MASGEIPREQWIKTLDSFSKDHQGWVVELEVVGGDVGGQEEVNGLPLAARTLGTHFLRLSPNLA